MAQADDDRTARDNEREQVAFRERAKAFEAILRANPPQIRVETGAAGTGGDTKADDKPKKRDVLFRGNVYAFNQIELDLESQRRHITERWQADIRLQDGPPYHVVVNQFRDGHFSPWTFDGIGFGDFLQAAIVGVVAGTFQAKWVYEQWSHERTRRRLILMVLPLVGIAALAVGFLLGLRHG